MPGEIRLRPAWLLEHTDPPTAPTGSSDMHPVQQPGKACSGSSRRGAATRNDCRTARIEDAVTSPASALAVTPESRCVASPTRRKSWRAGPPGAIPGPSDGGGAITRRPDETGGPRTALRVGTWRRSTAYAIDTIVLLVFWIVGEQFAVPRFGGVASGAVDFSYFAVCWWRFGATFGQRALGLRVLDAESSGRITLAQASVALVPPGWSDVDRRCADRPRGRGVARQYRRRCLRVGPPGDDERQEATRTRASTTVQPGPSFCRVRRLGPDCARSRLWRDRGTATPPPAQPGVRRTKPASIAAAASSTVPSGCSMWASAAPMSIAL